MIENIICKFPTKDSICNKKVNYEMHPNGVYVICQENPEHIYKFKHQSVEEERIEFLAKDSDYLPISFYRSYWGLTSEEVEFIFEKVEKWTAYYDPESVVIKGDCFSRFCAEIYFNNFQLIPRKQALKSQLLQRHCLTLLIILRKMEFRLGILAALTEELFTVRIF